MKEVGLYEAKTQLSALVESVSKSGETVLLTRHGKVVAELRPPAKSAPKRGCLKSKAFQMAEDFDDEGLGFEDFWKDAERRRRGSGKRRRRENQNAAP